MMTDLPLYAQMRWAAQVLKAANTRCGNPPNTAWTPIDLLADSEVVENISGADTDRFICETCGAESACADGHYQHWLDCALIKTCPKCYAGVQCYRDGAVWRYGTHSTSNMTDVRLCAGSWQIIEAEVEP